MAWPRIHFMEKCIYLVHIGVFVVFVKWISWKLNTAVPNAHYSPFSGMVHSGKYGQTLREFFSHKQSGMSNCHRNFRSFQFSGKRQWNVCIASINEFFRFNTMNLFKTLLHLHRKIIPALNALKRWIQKKRKIYRPAN